MSNDGSMGTASIYYSSTSTIVIIWLEIGLRGRNAIWNFGMENCHLWAYSLPSLVDIISHHYQRSAVWMYPLVLYKEPVGRFFILVCNGVDLGALWWWKQIWAEREWVFYVTSSWRHGVWTQIFLRIQHIKWGVLQRDSMLWAVELQMGRAVTRALGAWVVCWGLSRNRLFVFLYFWIGIYL